MSDFPHAAAGAGLLAALAADAWYASCAVCAPALQQALLGQARCVSLVAGASLFDRGNAAEGLCCVVAGALRVGTLAAGGADLLLARIKPGQWFGEISLIDGQPRTHTATADGPAQVLLVRSFPLLAWLDAHPVHWRDMARLATRLCFGVLKRLWLVGSGYGMPAMRTQLQLPQEQLALMPGVSRQSVNKGLHYRGMEAWHGSAA